MAENSNIEWCDHTLNLWEGCTRVSPACDHCYAEARANRFKSVEWGNHPRKRMSPATRNKCHKWQREAAKFYAEHGRKQRVFVNSLSDLFDNKAPQEWRDEHFEQVKACPDLIFIWLTKRPQNITKFLPADWGNGYENVWLGTTVENQEEANRRIPILLDTPAKLRLLSCEPLLGEVDISKYMWPVHAYWPAKFKSPEEARAAGMVVIYKRQGLVSANSTFIDWVICGGESGPGARPMHPDWPRALRDQCHAAKVPFFMKQWGEWWPDDQHQFSLRFIGKTKAEKLPQSAFHPWDNGDLHQLDCSIRVGKKSAGRLLDGVEHNEFPETPRIMSSKN